MTSTSKVLIADYSDEQQGKDICYLLDCYATDPMGGGLSLSSRVKENLVAELAKLPNAFSLICYSNDKPVGLTNCFVGFSTFNCKPLINIHDIAVLRNYRGRGIGQLMLAKVEEIARQENCCKITLEVLEGNEPAKRAYQKSGFAGYELNPELGKALYWQKIIN